MTQIGNNVRLLRERKGLTRAELAELIDRKMPTIYAIENGARLPSFEVLLALADVFGVTTDALARADIERELEAA